jgi:hypothetical protein
LSANTLDAYRRDLHPSLAGARTTLTTVSRGDLL